LEIETKYAFAPARQRMGRKRTAASERGGKDAAGDTVAKGLKADDHELASDVGEKNKSTTCLFYV
jgi:hypothetical protein